MPLLFLLFLLSPLFGAFDKSRFLYQNGSDLKIELSNQHRSFEAIRKDGRKLRRKLVHERFFIDKSDGALQIGYRIERKVGGVDIHYTLYNPTSKPQPFPDLQIEGLAYRPQNASLSILNTLTFAWFHERTKEEASFVREGYWDVNGGDLPYPQVYAPVIVAADSDFAAGSALLIDYPKMRISPHMRIYEGKNRTFTHRFCDIENRKLQPGEKLLLTLTLRFGSPRYAIATLSPYKRFFQSRFHPRSPQHPPKVTPISGILLSFEGSAYENYRTCLRENTCNSKNPLDPDTIRTYNLLGYNHFIRLDKVGQMRRFVSHYIRKLRRYGYREAMLWAISGEYFDCTEKYRRNEEGTTYCASNYPPQFMSNPLPEFSKRLKILKAFREKGIRLGVWWGRSGESPRPYRWNPQNLVPLDPTDPEAVAFAMKEFRLALKSGAEVFGLDAFGHMAPSHQRRWLRRIKSEKEGIELWIEGDSPDYLHTEAALFLQPQNRWLAFGKGPISQPPLLMRYLNPAGKIILYYPSGNIDRAKVAKLMKMGYTPLILSDPDLFENGLIDVEGLDGSVAECCDGFDNDGDGLCDYPFDPECRNPLDSER